MHRTMIDKKILTATLRLCLLNMLIFAFVGLNNFQLQAQSSWRFCLNTNTLISIEEAQRFLIEDNSNLTLQKAHESLPIKDSFLVIDVFSRDDIYIYLLHREEKHIGYSLGDYELVSLHNGDEGSDTLQIGEKYYLTLIPYFKRNHLKGHLHYPILLGELNKRVVSLPIRVGFNIYTSPNVNGPLYVCTANPDIVSEKSDTVIGNYELDLELGKSEDSSCLTKKIFYGTDSLGELIVINDSEYVMSFYFNTYDNALYDTGTYVIIGDTMLLYSKVRRGYVHIKDDVSIYDFWNEYHAYLYRFEKGRYVRKKYFPVNAFGNDYYNKHFDFHLCSEIKTGDIIVFEEKSPFLFRRFLIDTFTLDGQSLSLLRFIDTKADRLYFDAFPLLLKKDSIIPIDSEKNFRCWVENGFYFPTMKREHTSKKKIKFKRILLSERGIQGLVNKIIINK